MVPRSMAASLGIHAGASGRCRHDQRERHQRRPGHPRRHRHRGHCSPSTATTPRPPAAPSTSTSAARHAGSQYDQLAVSGTATLGGTVNVALINGFQPALGNTFQPLTFASSSGNFGFYNGIVLGNRLILDPDAESHQPDAHRPAGRDDDDPLRPAFALGLRPERDLHGHGDRGPAADHDRPGPTGTVTFYNNGTSIGTGTLSVVNGQDQASLTTQRLSTASHPITAAYTSGDANFIPSPASTAVTQVVNKANTSATVATSLSPVGATARR